MTKTDRKSPPGRPARHGGYSLMVKRGELPERLTHIRRHLEAVRAGLIQDVAGKEAALTAAQGVLIDRAISLLGVIRTIEETLSGEGIMNGAALAPILAENYITYVNSLRLILRELGINRRMIEDAPSALDIAASIDEAKENAAALKAAGGQEEGQGAGKDPGPGEIAPPGANGAVEGPAAEPADGDLRGLDAADAKREK